MKILLCCENYPPSIGGVQEVIRQIAERLVRKGHDVTVLTSSHPERSDDTLRNGVRVLSYPISGNLIRGISGPIDLYRIFLRSHTFDVIMIKAVQQWTFDAAIDVLPSIGARKFLIPCGFSGLQNPKYANYFSDMPQWLALFDGLIFYAKDYQDVSFARQHGLTRLHFVSNGVDEREFLDPGSGGIRASLRIPERDDLILSVGSLIAAKGHWEVIRAFSHSHLNNPATLVINGNSPGSSFIRIMRAIKHVLSGRLPLSWEAKFSELRSLNQGTGKRIIVTNLQRDQLVSLYKAADLFVYASHVEYSPLVLFEAAAAGTPFLSSTAGNAREIAALTGAGTIFDARDSKISSTSKSILSLGIETMLRDRGALQTLGAAGRSAIFERGLTWDKIVDKYESLFLMVDTRLR